MKVRTLENAVYVHPDNALEVCCWRPDPVAAIAEARDNLGVETSQDIGGGATAYYRFATGRPEEPGFVFRIESSDGLLPSFVRRTLLWLMAAEEAGAEFPVLINGQRMAAIDALMLVRHTQD